MTPPTRLADSQGPEWDGRGSDADDPEQAERLKGGSSSREEDEEETLPDYDPELDADFDAEEDEDKPKKDEEEDAEEEEEVQHPDTKVPTPAAMKSAMEWAFAKELADGQVDAALLEGFAKHARMMLEKNRVMNLTAILEPKEVAAKHYLDSWRITQLVPLLARRVLDLGTGAGFPGLPLAMAEPNLSMILVDSKKKKADFLRECIQKLGVRNAHAVAARAEEYLMRERVDVVLVRAVSSVRENVRTLRKVRHSVKDLVMIKGPSWSREVRAAEREAERLGFKLDTVMDHELPGGMGKSAILVYRAPGGDGL